MVGNRPVVEVIKDKGTGEQDDRYEIEESWLLVNHVSPVLQRGRLVVNTVVVLIPLQGVDGEDEGVLKDGAEDHEDAGHHELVDGVELARGGRWGAGANVVEDVDDDEEEDDQEGHAARDDLRQNFQSNRGRANTSSLDRHMILPAISALDPRLFFKVFQSDGCHRRNCSIFNIGWKDALQIPASQRRPIHSDSPQFQGNVVEF